MNISYYLRPGVVAAAVLLLVPMLAAGFCPSSVDKLARWLPRILRVAGPGLLCVPYALTAASFGIFRWGWFAVYSLLPVAIAFVLEQARNEDSKQRGDWREFAGVMVLVVGAGRAVV